MLARRRERLFSLINELPTCYEVVSGKAAAAAPANKGKKRAAAGGAGAPRKQYKQVRVVRYLHSLTVASCCPAPFAGFQIMKPVPCMTAPSDLQFSNFCAVAARDLQVIMHCRVLVRPQSIARACVVSFEVLSLCNDDLSTHSIDNNFDV